MLYIDPRGPYPGLVGPSNCWGPERDARTFTGPGPVVAHPPCGPWSNNQRRNYKGAEHDCAPLALAHVRRFGGVLEHPRGSKLWHEPLGLPRPWRGAPSHTDRFGGFTIQVTQVEWGHVARKPTWLYIVGVSRERVGELVDARPFPGRQPTHWLSGGRTKSSRRGSPVPPGIKVCSAQQRRRTPPAFAQFLIYIAGSSQQTERGAAGDWR